MGVCICPNKSMFSGINKLERYINAFIVGLKTKMKERRTSHTCSILMQNRIMQSLLGSKINARVARLTI